MEELAELLLRIALKEIAAGGLWGLIAQILLTLSGWSVAWYVHRILKRERQYWRTTQKLRNDANERVLNKAIEVFETFVNEAREQRNLIATLLRGLLQTKRGRGRKDDD